MYKINNDEGIAKRKNFDELVFTFVKICFPFLVAKLKHKIFNKGQNK